MQIKKILKTLNIIKQGIQELNEIFSFYNYKVILLADRDFKIIDLYRIYSLFSCEIKWFNTCYDSSVKKYRLKFDFILYDI